MSKNDSHKSFTIYNQIEQIISRIINNVVDINDIIKSIFILSVNSEIHKLTLISFLSNYFEYDICIYIVSSIEEYDKFIKSYSFKQIKNENLNFYKKNKKSTQKLFTFNSNDDNLTGNENKVSLISMNSNMKKVNNEKFIIDNEIISNSHILFGVNCILYDELRKENQNSNESIFNKDNIVDLSNVNKDFINNIIYIDYSNRSNSNNQVQIIKNYKLHNNIVDYIFKPAFNFHSNQFSYRRPSMLNNNPHLINNTNINPNPSKDSNRNPDFSSINNFIFKTQISTTNKTENLFLSLSSCLFFFIYFLNSVSNQKYFLLFQIFSFNNELIHKQSTLFKEIFMKYILFELIFPDIQLNQFLSKRYMSIVNCVNSMSNNEYDDVNNSGYDMNENEKSTFQLRVLRSMNKLNKPISTYKKMISNTNTNTHLTESDINDIYCNVSYELIIDSEISLFKKYLFFIINNQNYIVDFCEYIINNYIKIKEKTYQYKDINDTANTISLKDFLDSYEFKSILSSADSLRIVLISYIKTHLNDEFLMFQRCFSMNNSVLLLNNKKNSYISSINHDNIEVSYIISKEFQKLIKESIIELKTLSSSVFVLYDMKKKSSPISKNNNNFNLIALKKLSEINKKSMDLDEKIKNKEIHMNMNMHILTLGNIDSDDRKETLISVKSLKSIKNSNDNINKTNNSNRSSVKGRMKIISEKLSKKNMVITEENNINKRKFSYNSPIKSRPLEFIKVKKVTNQEATQIRNISQISKIKECENSLILENSAYDELFLDNKSQCKELSILQKSINKASKPRTRNNSYVSIKNRRSSLEDIFIKYVQLAKRKVTADEKKEYMKKMKVNKKSLIEEYKKGDKKEKKSILRTGYSIGSIVLNNGILEVNCIENENVIIEKFNHLNLSKILRIINCNFDMKLVSLYYFILQTYESHISNKVKLRNKINNLEIIEFFYNNYIEQYFVFDFEEEFILCVDFQKKVVFVLENNTEKLKNQCKFIYKIYI